MAQPSVRTRANEHACRARRSRGRSRPRRARGWPTTSAPSRRRTARRLFHERWHRRAMRLRQSSRGTRRIGGTASPGRRRRAARFRRARAARARCAAARRASTSIGTNTSAIAMSVNVLTMRPARNHRRVSRARGPARHEPRCGCRTGHADGRGDQRTQRAIEPPLARKLAAPLLREPRVRHRSSHARAPRAPPARRARRRAPRSAGRRRSSDR